MTLALAILALFVLTVAVAGLIALFLILGRQGSGNPHAPAAMGGSIIPSLQEIGLTEALCPSCKGALRRKPGAKTKCPKCGEFIYVRKRPIDGEKALFTEAQLELLDEQKAIANGTYNEFIQERACRERLKIALVQQLNRVPTKGEIELAVLDEKMRLTLQDGNVSEYCLLMSYKSDYLSKEERHDEALRLGLQVLYLWLNCPVPIHFEPGEARRYTGRLWNPKKQEALQDCRGKILGVAYHMAELGWREREVKPLFFSSSQSLAASLNLPLPPDRAWSWVAGELMMEADRYRESYGPEQDEEEDE